MPIIKRIVLIIVLSAAYGFSILSSAGPKIESWQTDNGVKVLFVAAPELPILDIRLTFNAGSAREQQPGVALMTAGMLTQGAGEWNADQIAERLESVGSSLGSGSLRDMAWLTLRTLTQDFALTTSLETLATILKTPTFPDADLERLRKNTLVALNIAEQDPETVGSKAFYQALYGTHPYAHDLMGTKSTVAIISKAELQAHFARYYVAKNAVLALVGAIDHAQAVKIANQITAGLAQGTSVPPLAPVAKLTAVSPQQLLDFPSKQSHVYLGQPGIARSDPDYFALYVGNHVLGGNGLVSTLSKEIREQRGLSYNVYSSFSPMQQPGPFTMGLQTKNNQVKQALDVLRQTLQRFIAEGPSEKELQDAKLNITGGFPLRISSNTKITEYLGTIGFFNLPLDYLDTFNTKVNAITVAQVRDAFQRRLDPERFVTIVVGPLQDTQHNKK